MTAAGFVGFEITWRADVFGEAPQSSSAAEFETVGINFRARRYRDEAEWDLALAALGCDVPAAAAPQAPPQPVGLLGADKFYDAGSQGCGDGPLDKIARLLRELAPGQTLEVRAIDPSVKFDLPAWCRLTGHPLLRQQDDRYLIERKQD